MSQEAFHEVDPVGEEPSVQCPDCQSAFESGGRDGRGFLLLDELRIPLAGCPEHREQFRSICGLTTEDEARMLPHRPAGGLTCQACHLSGHEPRQPLLPVTDGAVLVLACPTHQTEIINRFHTGLETRQQLTSSVDGL